MKHRLTLLFLVISSSFLCQEDTSSDTGMQIIEGAIVYPEYLFDFEASIIKNNQSTYIIQSNSNSNVIGITGIDKHIGQFDYNQLLIDPRTESFVYLDSKSMTGVTSVMPITVSNEKIAMKLLPEKEMKILEKSCIVVSFEKGIYQYKIWLTQEENTIVSKRSLTDLNILLNVEELGSLSDLKITNQAWMRLEVTNIKTKTKNSFQLTQYYKSIDQSIMTFDYAFIVPKWD